MEASGYSLTRDWFKFCFDNPEKIKPVHTALYLFIVDLCNSLDWKEKFGLPSERTMLTVGVRNWKTYRKTLDELVGFGFISFIERSKNQYTSNIIALVKNTKAHTKASTKATPKHMPKQRPSTVGIDKPIKPKETEKHILQKKLDEENLTFPNCKEKLSFDECERLMKDYEPNLLLERLCSIHNHAKGKYQSVNLTVRNWLRRDGIIPASQIKQTHEAFRKVLEKKDTDEVRKHLRFISHLIYDEL